jgi:amidase
MSFQEYESLDAIGLAEHVRRGDVDPKEVLEAAIERLERSNPTLNAVVIPMLDEARRVVAKGPPDGPLRGVPFLLKDLFLLYAGTTTTNGCRFFTDNVANHDSELVRRYRNAGLVVFGKSASPEFGLTTTTESTLFGVTRNPWNLEHTTGGSSGGAAAAVAAGILPAANASDGGGSIRIPASCCGLFGLKPTRGRIPFGPDAGEGWSGMSTIHAVSRSVRDNALLLDISEGADMGAPYEARAKTRPYLEEVGAPVGQLRIGLLRQTFNGTDTHPDCREAVEDAAALCESLGHRIEEVKIELDIAAMGAASQSIMGGNLLATLEDRATALGRDFGPDDLEPHTFAMTEAIRSRGASDYARSVHTIHGIGRQIEGLFEHCDVLLSPTMGEPPRKIGVLALSNPDRQEFARAVLTSVGYTQVFNASGHPAMSVPLCWNGDNLPIGIQFVAPLGDEARLLRLAAKLEEARPWADRRPAPIA